MVRNLVCAILEEYGYEVLEAENAEEAFALIDQQKDPVRLLLTDVIMPGLSGKALYDKLAVSYPGLKVLYMSGYTDNVIAHHGILDPGIHFIQKPFSEQTLMQKVREALDA